MSTPATEILQLPAPSKVWPTVWSYLRHGPAHFIMYTAGRFQPVRKLAVWSNGRRNPPLRHVVRESRDLVRISQADAIDSLLRDGVCQNLFLRDETLRELGTYSEEAICYGDGNRAYAFRIAERDRAQRQFGTVFTSSRYLDCTYNCGVLRRLMRDPTLRNIARGYFGSEPVLVGARMWWSFAAPEVVGTEAQNGQTYHYDIDGYRSVAFFFYLTDVDAESGAHVWVRGSHLNKKLKHLISIRKSRSDAEIHRTYPAEDIFTLSGRAGQGFGEDTFCFHKGSRPRFRDRLIVQIRFGLRDYGTGQED